MKTKRFTTFAVTLVTSIMLLLGGAVSCYADAEEAPKLDGTSVIMIDAVTGDVLYEKNADEKRDPASITKILTCLIILENMDMDRKVTITEDSSPIGINIGMKKGEVFTVEQLLYAMMLPSANDAARQLAIAEAGDVDAFCSKMNARAKQLGAADTNFTNPNGLNLPGQEHHRTTARDLSKITQAAMENAAFRKIVATRKYTIPATNKSDERVLKGTDPLLGSKKSVEVDGEKIPLRYEGATGVKTGTTSVAGNCFVGASTRGDTSLIAVVLDSGDMTRFTDAIRLMDYGYDNYETQIVLAKGDEADIMRVRRGETGKVAIGAAAPLGVTLVKGAGGKAVPEETSLDIVKKEKKLTAPVRKGDVVGTITLKDDAGRTLMQTEAVALASVGEGGILSRIGIPDDMVPLFLIAVITLILLVLVIAFLRRNKKKAARRRKPAGKKSGKPTESVKPAGPAKPAEHAKPAKPAEKKSAPERKPAERKPAERKPDERRLPPRTEAGEQSFDEYIRDLKMRVDAEKRAGGAGPQSRGDE